jgi:hypothetical protein
MQNHAHIWTLKENESEELIKWCTSCDATMDSDGGIIE